jgi:hypothetical protein
VHRRRLEAVGVADFEAAAPDCSTRRGGGKRRFEAHAIAACGGDVRAALKAMIVANEFLESEVCELMQAVSHAYVRGRFNTYNG